MHPIPPGGLQGCLPGALAEILDCPDTALPAFFRGHLSTPFASPVCARAIGPQPPRSLCWEGRWAGSLPCLQFRRLAGARLAQLLCTARLELCLLGSLSSDWSGRGLVGGRVPPGGGASQALGRQRELSQSPSLPSLSLRGQVGAALPLVGPVAWAEGGSPGAVRSFGAGATPGLPLPWAAPLPATFHL